MMTGRSAPSTDETRARLLEAAHVIFAELGFHGATTRMICERAQANPAAVNYHFGDKMGLYTEVLNSHFCEDRMQINGQELLEMEPEVALAEFIFRFFYGLMGAEAGELHIRIMGHELSNPTQALPTVVEQIIRPHSELLCKIISRISGVPPESVGASLAAQSIMAQVTQYMNARRMLHLLWDDSSKEISNEGIIAHITKFSLDGLRAG